MGFTCKCGFYKITESQKCFCSNTRKPKKTKNTGEKELFKQIAIKRAIKNKVKCEVCNKPIDIKTLTHWNFDHEIPKSRGEEYRLNEDNIRIKCVKCHFDKTTGLNLKVEYIN